MDSLGREGLCVVDLDESLVTTATEGEPRVKQRLHEGTIDQHIYILQRRAMLGRAQEIPYSKGTHRA